MPQWDVLLQAVQTPLFDIKYLDQYLDFQPRILSKLEVVRANIGLWTGNWGRLGLWDCFIPLSNSSAVSTKVKKLVFRAWRSLCQLSRTGNSRIHINSYP